MHTAMDYVQIVLLAAWVVLTLWGWLADAHEQNQLREELELLHERLDRAGFPTRLPVHVDTSPQPEAAPGDATTAMPVVGRHRKGAATDARVVGVRG